MHIVSKKALRLFWAIHPRSRKSLEAWFKKVSKVEWDDFTDVTAMFPHADRFERFVIFDIGGNKYRLIATIHYNRRMLFVRNVLTHADYTQGDWKNQ